MSNCSTFQRWTKLLALTDLLADSNSWLEGERHKYLTQEITFRRGVESVSLSATILDTAFEVQDFEGNLLTHQGVNFIVRPEDLGESYIPQAGDTIERAIGCKVYTYEVWTPTGEDLFKVDTNRDSMTIHTHLIGEDPS